MSWERRSGPAAGRGPGLRAPSHVEDHDWSLQGDSSVSVSVMCTYQCTQIHLGWSSHTRRHQMLEHSFSFN